MNVTTAMVDGINNVLGGVPDPLHYITRTQGQPFIIYGMDDPQRTYLAVDHFRRNGFGAGADHGAAIHRRATGDGANNAGQFDKRKSPLVSNYVLHFNPADVSVTQRPTNELELNRPAQVGPRARETARVQFTNDFNGSNFSLLSIGTDTNKIMKGVRKDKGNTNVAMALDVAAFNGELRNFAVRRACKFLIYDAVKDGKHIAYALDDMDLAAVANKQWHDWDTSTFVNESALNPASNAKVPVCTSEIREIFRGWDFLKTYVTFYEGFVRVDPPWERNADRDTWGAYARVLARHLLRKYPNAAQIGNVRATLEWCIGSTNAANAITRYHECHASVFRGKHGIVPLAF